MSTTSAYRHAWRAAVRTLALLCTAWCSSCTVTTYSPISATPDTSTPPEIGRAVQFDLKPELLAGVRRCVMLAPLAPGSNPRLVAMLEESMEMHLAARFSRVVFGQARDEAAKRDGYNLADVRSDLAFARHIDCDSVLTAQITAANAFYLLFFTEYRLGLELKLLRNDGQTVWTARHVAKRSSGGLAATPLGAAFSAASATASVSDDDIVPSLIDDLTRRLFNTLPFMQLANR